METLKSLLGFDCQSTVVVVPTGSAFGSSSLFPFWSIYICDRKNMCVECFFFFLAAAASSFTKLDVIKRSERTCTTSSIVNR